MHDEEIDKLVRDAASQHHPPYDDEAWGKMEDMLDKHLPQKKDRKRPIIFLLSFLLLGGAAFWGIEKALHNTNSVASAANSTVATTAAENNTATIPAKTENATTTPGNSENTTAGSNIKVDPQEGNTGINSGTNTSTTNTNNNVTAGTLNRTPHANTATGNSARKYLGDGNNNEVYAGGKKNRHNQKGHTSMKVKGPGIGEGDDNTATQKTQIEKTDIADNTTITVDAPAKEIKTDKESALVTKPVVANDVKEVKPAGEKTPAVKNNTTTSVKNKSNKSFADKLAVTVSAGSDLSFIDLSKAGKLKPAFGAGLSYAVGKHFTISSGLYVSKKVYTASPYQYKFGGYVNPNLKEVGADCKVFEIPVSVYYSFNQAKHHNWLAGISLSSLLMKRESYDYRYETPAGQYYSYEKTVTNENKHYFSVLTLSGGYQYKFNNRFSLIAEPYIKVPLAGIGLGKIKLNSTGILVTAAIKPFSKKQK